LFRKDIDDGDDTLVGSQITDLLVDSQRNLLQGGGDAPTTYTVQVADRYRDDPTGFPDDELAPMTLARLDVPDLGLDTTQRVVQVVRTLDRPLQTTVQLGALRRRLTTLV
jgi:hypothetical protein